MSGLLLLLLLQAVAALAPPGDSRHCAGALMPRRFADDHGNAYTVDIAASGAVQLRAEDPASSLWSRAEGTLDVNFLNVTFPELNVTLRGMLHGSCGRINWGNELTASYSQLNICPFRPTQGACSVQQANPHNQLPAARIPCCAWRAIRPHVKKAHVVFMTHFDLSCTDQRSVICGNYFNSYLPLYAQTAAELRRRADPSGARLRYTTWPWLIHEFFNSTASCAAVSDRPNASTRALVERGIREGDIIWQGKALNLQPELCDRDTYDYSLSEAAALNTRFNKSWGRAAAKSADVAGFSRGVVPPLAKRGIKFLHIGWNAACLMPAVPALTRWQAGGAEVLLQAADTYGDDLVLPNWDEALVFLYSVDNRPPPSADNIIAFFKASQHAYPNAELVVSSMDEFAEALWQERERLAVPILTQEMYAAAALPSLCRPVWLTFGSAQG